MTDDENKPTGEQSRSQQQANSDAESELDRIIKARRDELQDALDVLDMPSTLHGVWNPDIPREHLRAAGGHSCETIVELDDDALLQIAARWTVGHIDLTWTFHGVSPSSYLVIAFRDPTERRLLCQPHVAGPLHLAAWSASSTDLGFSLDVGWELVAVVICDR